MPLYRARLLGLFSNGVPNDLMSMSWGVEAPSVPSPVDLQAAWLLASENSQLGSYLNSMMSSKWSTYAWEVSAATGGSVLDYGRVAAVTGGGNPATAPQVAIPVQTVVNHQFWTARRGRLMIGPLSSTNAHSRPNSTNMARVLLFCTRFYEELQARGMTQVQLLDGGTVGAEIVGYSTGDSYGTIESRRSEVTQRTTVML